MYTLQSPSEGMIYWCVGRGERRVGQGSWLHPGAEDGIQRQIQLQPKYTEIELSTDNSTNSLQKLKF